MRKAALAALALTVLAALSLAACQGKPHVPGGIKTMPPCEAPAPKPPPAPVAAPEPGPDPRSLIQGVRIYFDFDSDELTEEAMAVLDRVAQVLVENPDIRVELQGYCDLRGSDTYNRALGMRRAQSGRAYLAQRGVDPARVVASTGGKENPLVEGTTEEAFARNRRCEFFVLPE